MSRIVAVLLSFILFFVLVGQSAAAGQVNVFIYHRFDESRYPSTNISADIFRQQLNYLKENQYQVLSLGEVVRRLIAAEPLPEKAVALCIDDAFTSFVEVGMPLLREFGYPVSLFINTDAVATHGYLDWAQIKALHDEGVEIGNHTATHAYLVEKEPGEEMSAWHERVVADIIKAQQRFEKHLGAAPSLFVYPYGEYSSEVVDIVKQIGFTAAFAQQSGVIHSGHDLFTLPRFPMGGAYATLEGFVNKLKMKPLVVSEEEPFSAVVINNPPELLLDIDTADVDMRRVNCFVQGENSCQIEAVSGRDGWYRVIAEQPLSSRRNKYTLTVPGKKGGWHWYSHLWINAKLPALETKMEAVQKEAVRDEKSAADAKVDGSEALEPVGADQ
ncbi:MAG: polysaccharide deacetylase family protein [Desulfuromusa sp.]|nr:polysaccharide deacetylase family protein [Desulfuromusa sp.]